MKKTIWCSAAAALWLVTGQAAMAKSGASCVASQISQVIASTGLDADGTAVARWRQDDRCRQSFSVELEDVAAGDYALLVGDALRGTIAVRALPSGQLEGEIELEAADDTPHPLTLDFDPRGQVVRIQRGSDVFFADVFGSDATPGTPTATRTPTSVPNATTPTAAATRTDDRGGQRTATRTPSAARSATPAATRTDDRGGLRTATRTPSLQPTRTVTPARTASPTRTGTIDQREPEAERGGGPGHR